MLKKFDVNIKIFNFLKIKFADMPKWGDNLKKLFAMLVMTGLMLILTVTASAVNYEVCAENVSTAVGESVEIPIVLKNNKGLMGLKISLNWSPEEIEIVSVKRGDLLKKGNYNTNFGNRDSCFDVLWNSTENVAEDGTLFVLSARIKQTVKSSAKIKLSFSRDDTFNSSWEDVTLNCSEITVERDDTKVSMQVTTQSEQTVHEVTASSLPSNEKILEIYASVLSEMGYKTVYDAAQHSDFLEKLNQRLLQAMGTDNGEIVAGYDSVINLYEQTYESVFFAKVTEMDGEQVSSAVQEVLQKMGISSVSDIPEKKEEKFVKEVQKRLNKLNSDMPNVAEDVDTDEAMKLFKQAYGMASGGVPQEVELSEKNDTWIIVAAVAAAAAIIAAVTIITCKRKNEEVSE